MAKRLEFVNVRFTIVRDVCISFSSLFTSLILYRQSSRFNGSQCKIANPHSNAVVDLNGDCLAGVYPVHECEFVNSDCCFFFL